MPIFQLVILEHCQRSCLDPGVWITGRNETTHSFVSRRWFNQLLLHNSMNQQPGCEIRTNLTMSSAATVKHTENIEIQLKMGCFSQIALFQPRNKHLCVQFHQIDYECKLKREFKQLIYFGETILLSINSISKIYGQMEIWWVAKLLWLFEVEYYQAAGCHQICLKSPEVVQAS
ncbi:Hypothetical_protein [Hexamita inflata]|uniref:Hypothetical_protein n=1 Tax=Hexamita inflata TaxID=28002 RepID=A0AA86Q175_9EUKA|nr:Hypothetical protein HINF_LOCUS37536 [Hexamita inflata]